jgi:hypothetical protein
LLSPAPALTGATGNASATKNMDANANEKMLIFIFEPVRVG